MAMQMVARNLSLFQRGNDVRIGYFDAQDVYTERVVTVERRFVSEEGHRVVVAFCHLRGLSRFFRLDRIAFAAPADAPLSAQGRMVPPGLDERDYLAMRVGLAIAALPESEQAEAAHAVAAYPHQLRALSVAMGAAVVAIAPRG